MSIVEYMVSGQFSMFQFVQQRASYINSFPGLLVKLSCGNEFVEFGMTGSMAINIFELIA